ncbi:MAG: MutH/Sau3AI family endonuclease [Chloroflexota bacterium]|nr:MutH/Sau3AI family endonuclease [Chloroflexota bacterium]
MEREEAIRRLQLLKGEDLHKVGECHGIYATVNGRQNKGWAGQVCERHLGLPLNSARSPNFGSWELKVVPLKYLKNGALVFKETMAICMIDKVEVARNDFYASHLLRKLSKMVVVARTVESDYTEPSYVYKVIDFVLSEELYEHIEKDYDEVRSVIRDPRRGFDCLTGRMGVLVQPRTKGPGHGSQSRAFYARKELLREIFGSLN